MDSRGTHNVYYVKLKVMSLMLMSRCLFPLTYALVRQSGFEWKALLYLPNPLILLGSSSLGIPVRRSFLTI
ncbi:hypothetical protein ALP24_02923 [Pseudomonas syringae pv. aptata]|uniref:Uncharacterized protein n=1 Tax=Pseudomonas syringae pv. aptata TaxID=83167 RepID=A0A3M5X4N1_PSEAP|nr:hypothetical protein ALP24_02923 [Pseudomonas syringae pv. aptata]